MALIGRLRVLDAAGIPWDGPAGRLIVHDGHAPGHGADKSPEWIRVTHDKQVRYFQRS